MLSRILPLKESEVEFSFFAHHVLIPFWLKDDIDVDCLDIRYAFELLLYVFKDEVGSRAVGGSKCHIDVDVECLVVDRQFCLMHIYLLYHAEIPYIDWNLRVENCLEVFDSLFFNFVFCHFLKGCF